MGKSALAYPGFECVFPRVNQKGGRPKPDFPNKHTACPRIEIQQNPSVIYCLDLILLPSQSSYPAEHIHSVGGGYDHT